jgi:hypothetical protein
MIDKLNQNVNYVLTNEELQLVHSIHNAETLLNKDNITRTKAYLDFYLQHPEITWAFLASMVSRNGGWNMCDLEGEWFPKIIPKEERNRLFFTFEKANWLIFHDAFPQLLLYHYSTKLRRPMFHLSQYFRGSSFMESEWNWFWFHSDSQRLMNSLIINEQNVIQKPVIERPIYHKKVFKSGYFLFQDWFHFSSVLFPTCKGELYGASVNGFRDVDKRINLGKRLADILFHPSLFPYFLHFACRTEHTGSRVDFEQYFSEKKKRDTPFLRTTFPVISHKIHDFQDWSKHQKIKKKWYREVRHIHPVLLTQWYSNKQKQMHTFITLGNVIK